MAAQDMNDISLPDFHLRFVDNLETVSQCEQRQMLDPGTSKGISWGGEGPGQPHFGKDQKREISQMFLESLRFLEHISEVTSQWFLGKARCKHLHCHLLNICL